MLLRDEQGKRKSVRKLLLMLLSVVGLWLLLIHFLIPTYLEWASIQQPNEIYCDMEQSWQGQYVSNGQWFGNGRSSSRAYARSGKASAHLAKGDGFQWGPGFATNDLQAGRYRASVWRLQKYDKGQGMLIVERKGDKSFKKEVVESVRKESSGWEKLEILFSLSEEEASERLEIFICSDGKGDFYFDDLRLQRLAESEVDSNSLALRQLHLNISEKALRKIEQKREAAFKAGLLISGTDDWVNGRLVEGDEEMPVKLRLKGDWVDHLEGKKWSFRIKVKDPFAWNRMKVFSVQHPKTRHFLWEWLIHQMWEREDVLTTRYDFAEVFLNGESRGIYAYEEHFEKQLLESRERREGPILKFSEDALWESRARNFEVFNTHRQEIGPLMAQSQQAGIEAFKENQIKASPTLQKQFEQGRQLMFQYQYGLAIPDAVFDLERLARFMAISDFMGAYHGIVWHNQRYYFNPVISKLEPIGYDAYGGKPLKPLFLSFTSSRIHQGPNIHPWKRLYYNEEFAALYAKCLMEFTSEVYLEKLLADLGPGIEDRLNLLQKEFPQFKFDYKEIWKRARLARASMLPYSQHSIISKWKERSADKWRLNLRSIHDMPIQVVGFGYKKDQISYDLSTPELLLPSPMQLDTLSKDFEIPAGLNFVFYQGIGIDSVFQSRLSEWEEGNGRIPAQALFKNGLLKRQGYFTEKEGEIRFKKGKHRVPGDIVIPKGYKVIFEGGVELDLVRSALFLSQSPVYMEGTAAEPVKIGSSDYSARGFTVLQSPLPSRLRHVQFENLNTLDYDGWTLTGGVTFYESDVDMAHCSFLNGQCEDALNLIRAKINIDDILIRKTLSDGLDADFCKGIIQNSRFELTGNDGLDISGSQIELRNCLMENCGDKGISAGEDSQLKVINAQVIGATIGLASKDFSEVDVQHIHLEDCNQGFAAYQKKAEFGPASIIVHDYSAENIKYLYTIAKACRLELKGQVIVGE